MKFGKNLPFGISFGFGSNPGGGAVYDADASAFLTAAGIPKNGTVLYSGTPQEKTGIEIWTAVNAFYVGCKTDSIYTKLTAFWLLIGGSQASHKLNGKNPLDTNAAFRLSFSGTWIHSETGAQPNGSNAYADTFLNPSTHIAANTGSLGYYSRTQNANNNIEMGLEEGGNGFEIFIRYFGDFYAIPNTVAAQAPTVANTNSTGFFQALRTGATTTIAQRNAVQTAFTSKTYGAPNGTVIIGGRTNGGSIDALTNRECSFAYVGAGMSDTDAENLYVRVQALQTALGREA
jgi:hypothetical protein